MTPEAFSAFAGLLPEPMLLVSGAGRVLALNPPAAAALAAAEPVGLYLTDLAADPPEKLARYLGACSRSRAMVLGALTLRRPDGQTRTWRCEGAVLRPWSPEATTLLMLRLRSREAAGRRFALLNDKIAALSRQVHERLEAEAALRRAHEQLEERVAERTAALSRANAELERSNRALEEFASVASHDLQEPLRKIQVFGTFLGEREARHLDPEGRAYLARMLHAARRMQTLITDLLKLSRVAAGRPLVPVDLDEVVRGVLADLEARIAQEAARVEVGPLPVIEADPLQMRQLLQNLIGNALKFHRPGVPPVVRISGEVVPAPQGAAGDGDARTCCRIEVADNGIGFDEQYRDRIFTLFQRLHGRGSYEGTGVGLAICQRIVERHGGRITARSRPGEGATFVVLLPVAHAQTEPAPPPPAAASVQETA